MKDISFFDQTIRYKTIDSTFDKARQLIINKQVRGNFLLLAEKQIMGKGRNHNKWFSPQGGLWFTAGFYNLPVRSSLTIYLALSIAKALGNLYPDIRTKLSIKWPNDIMLASKKMGGILTSAYPDLNYIISGIGLNTNNNTFPDNLAPQAVSLSSALNSAVDNDTLLGEIFDCFATGLPDYLDNELENLKPLFDEQYSFLKDKRVVLQTEFELYKGSVKGINKKGALILQLADGAIQPFYSGSITEIY
jgi:BirA family biotin operon repressor/biotin-[acetyl-CoA-carboxylase] ligase